jgi:hypothetical protein
MIVSGGVKYHPSLEPLMEPISALSPHPGNPNNGDYEEIAVSIEVNGMYRPVEAQRSTGFVLAGNTTYAACLLLDATIIPVVWLDVDDIAATRILLGDNQLARLAIMDQALLQPQIATLLETELRLLGTGYTEPPPPPPQAPPGHTVSVYLTADALASWFDVPGESDRERLFFLLDLR